MSTTTQRNGPDRYDVAATNARDEHRVVSTYRFGDRVVLLAPQAQPTLLTEHAARKLARYLTAHADSLSSEL